MNITGVNQQHHHHGGGLENFISRLQNDTSDEAISVKDAYKKLQADMKGGADADTLTADRQALGEAMKAFRAKNPPPPPPDGGKFLDKLAERLKGDTSAEGTQLAAAIQKLKDDGKTQDADKQSFVDALKAYFEKQRASGGAGGDNGQVVDCRA